MNESLESAMFRPPINRAMRALDRSFFRKSIPLSAARIRDNKQISRYRTELGRDLLKLDRTPAVRSVKDSEGQEAKALLLRPEVRPDGNIASFVFFSSPRRAQKGAGRGRAEVAVRCFYMESKALRVGQGFPGQPLAVQSRIRLRLLELPYMT